jgi:hypothetical protein
MQEEYATAKEQECLMDSDRYMHLKDMKTQDEKTERK